MIVTSLVTVLGPVLVTLLATVLVSVLGTFVYCTLLESSASAGKAYFTIGDISASVETEPLGLHAIRPRDLLQGFRYGGVPANDTQDQGRARADREHREQLRGSSSYKGIGWRQSLQEHQGQLHGSPSDESIGDTQSTKNDMNNREDLGNSEVYEF